MFVVLLVRAGVFQAELHPQFHGAESLLALRVSRVSPPAAACPCIALPAQQLQADTKSVHKQSCTSNLTHKCCIFFVREQPECLQGATAKSDWLQQRPEAL